MNKRHLIGEDPKYFPILLTSLKGEQYKRPCIHSKTFDIIGRRTTGLQFKTFQYQLMLSNIFDIIGKVAIGLQFTIKCYLEHLIPELDA